MICLGGRDRLKVLAKNDYMYLSRFVKANLVFVRQLNLKILRIGTILAIWQHIPQ
jgi:hypothetical protein